MVPYAEPASSESSCLKSHHVHNLILILRHANHHYAQVASRIRATLRPTFHARKHAYHLGLRIDVQKAVRCEQRHVSVQPLPILDLVVSPVTSRPSVTTRGRIVCPSEYPASRRRPAQKRTVSRHSIRGRHSLSSLPYIYTPTRNEDNSEEAEVDGNAGSSPSLVQIAVRLEDKPLIIRIKRKYTKLNVDHCETCPKFRRKSRLSVIPHRSVIPPSFELSAN